MNETMIKELVQAIRDIKRICQLRKDIQNLYDEIDEIRKSISIVSDKLEYPCIVKIGNRSIFITDSLLSYADSRKINNITTYDLEVTNHDDSNTRDD